jgi:hypothetical protein
LKARATKLMTRSRRSCIDQMSGDYIPTSILYRYGTKKGVVVMEPQKEQPKVRTGEDRSIRLDKESIQYNNQDMDQHQRVDVNPSQLNTQNLNIFIRNNNDLSGRITGVTCLEGSTERVANAEILLYFGSECKSPVHKTSSDANGNFRIEDLPPGFYTICSKYDGEYWYRSCHIKVLPGQKVFESIRLRKSC